MRHTPSDDELLQNAIPIDPEDAGDDADHVPTLDVVELTGPKNSRTQIHAFDGERKAHEDHWSRTPNATGQGAIHVKTFYCKLRPDGIAHMDEQINQWLDAHPEYEVKFTTSTIGPLVGKNKEDAMFTQVWV